ncbi:MAG: 4-hydroxy-tetrahydrodipicolinate reductase [Terriglobales bacterium]|jgi:4-hydroxy-tetrahydrodipicolinate reductase
MNLLVLGRGKTGSLVAEVAAARGHKVRSLGGDENTGASALTKEFLRDFDCVVDFTAPAAVIPNIIACTQASANMVVGTTGWYDKIPKVKELVEHSGSGFLYASNFSVGMNIFFDIAAAAGAAMKQGYSARIVERHHTQKKDAPSGTAVTIRQKLGAEDIEITSIREGDAAGQHVIMLDSPNDTMMLVHDSKSRRGFAEGAVIAAEWLQGKKGFFEFKDALKK